MDYNQRAFIIGMVGDILLQIIVRFDPLGDFAGLGKYFKQHGPFESALIAGGMMYFFGLLLDFLGLPKSLLVLSVYATILDVLFRVYNQFLFPSLGGYYAALTPTQSILWAIIPMTLPKFIVF
jgi:hypothetical protein